jgi:hypothetical protein
MADETYPVSLLEIIHSRSSFYHNSSIVRPWDPRVLGAIIPIEPFLFSRLKESDLKFALISQDGA